MHEYDVYVGLSTSKLEAIVLIVCACLFFAKHQTGPEP